MFAKSISSICQSTVPDLQAPNVATLNKFIDFPVDKSTGIPNIAIPIYSLKEKGFELPISVAYHAGGIRVEDQSSNVGLGWTLIADATISRTVKGVPDESGGGYYTNSGPYPFLSPFIIPPLISPPPITITPGQIYDQNEGWQDTEPDMFYFNVGNYSGKFIFDTGRKVRLIPQQDLKIVANTPWGSSFFTFTITTPEGIKYSFGYADQSAIDASATSAPISAWHVEKITLLNNQTIEFEYSQEGKGAERVFVHESSIVPKGWCPQLLRADSYQSTISYKISKIKSKSTEIHFNYKSTLREDCSPNYSFMHALDRIVVKSLISDDTIKCVNFYTSYFVSNDNSSIIYADYITKRLRLDSIKESGRNQEILSGYIFSYNKHNYTTSQKLPSKLCTSQDHWGFYNGKANGANLYPTLTFSNNSGTHFSTCVGANREPDSNYRKAYILDEIIYPTGGKVKYLYESTVHSSTIIGGLRVKEIILEDGATAIETKKKFTYENPAVVGGSPIYQQHIDNPIGFDYAPFYDICDLWISDTIMKYMCFTSPVNYSGQLTSNRVYFEKVIETIENNGSIESFYDVESLYGEQDLVDAQTYPFIIIQPLLLSGKLLKESYKNDTGFLQKEVEYSYMTYSKVANSFAGHKYNPFCHPFIRYYGLSTGAACLVAKQETDFISDTNYIIKRTEYEYGGIPSLTDLYINNVPVKHHLVTKQIDLLHENLITRFKYPLDFLNSGFITNLVGRNLISTPLEKTVSRIKSGSEYIIGGSVNTFKPGSVLVDKIYKMEVTSPVLLSNFVNSSMSNTGSFDFDTRYNTEMQFLKYDSISNIVEYQEKSNFKKTFIWDYLLQYPIASIDNADSTSVAFTSFESDGLGNWSLASSVRSNNASITGNKSYNLSNGNIVKSGLSDTSTYIVSYWSQSGEYNINSTGSVYVGETINGWTYYEHYISNASQVTVSGSGLIDELRLYPKGALMTTYTHKPLIGMSSKCDVNNRIAYYEYDHFNRLKLIKDQYGKILKIFDYKYQANNNQ